MDPKLLEGEAEPVAGRAKLGADADRLLDPQLKCAKYLQRLLDARLYSDALRFVAFLFPKQELVWWGCLCAWYLHKAQALKAQELEALRAAAGWARQPSEQNRRMAEQAGNKAGPETLAGSLALAAFLSRGSLSPPGMPQVTAAPPVAHQLVATVLVAAARGKGDPQGVAECQQHFLKLGIDLAQSRLRWKGTATPQRSDTDES